MHCSSAVLIYQAKKFLLIAAAEKAPTTYAQSLTAAATIVRPTERRDDELSRETNPITVAAAGGGLDLRGRRMRDCNRDIQGLR